MLTLERRFDMIYSDFVFDSICSDEYGVICVSFENSNITKTAVNTTKLTQNFVGGEFKIVEQTYSEPLNFKFQLLNNNYTDISQYQERAIKKWLMKKNKYSWFTILSSEYSDLFFKANISNPVNIFINGLNGIEFTVTCSTPYAYSELIEEYLDFSQSSSYSLYIDNDEETCIYPDIKITMLESGTLELRNNSIGNKMEIKNLVVGEVITINHSLPIIESSIQGKYIYDNFNFVWFTFADGNNLIESNKKCTIQLNYREIRKVGVN